MKLKRPSVLTRETIVPTEPVSDLLQSVVKQDEAKKHAAARREEIDEELRKLSVDRSILDGRGGIDRTQALEDYNKLAEKRSALIKERENLKKGNGKKQESES